MPALMNCLGPLARHAAAAGVAVAALLAGCSSNGADEADGPSGPPKSIYVYNPFRVTGERPYFHGEVNGWGLAQMTDFGCEWYGYVSPGLPGPFRFFGSDWSGPQWGSNGLGSDVNFDVDAVLRTSDTVFLNTSLDTGSTDITTFRPFECDPTQLPTLTNPYGTGQLPATARQHHLTELFHRWYANFYEEQGELARIRFDEPTQTVSEGIGYGMLIFVLADGVVGRDPQSAAAASGDWQAPFARLLAYYRAFADANGLMNWKTSGFSGVVQQGSASDADLDVAVALLVAAAKWSDPTYQDAALDLVGRIRQFEITAAGYLMPGDGWDAAKNPSYLSFVAFELFRRFDTGHEQFWADVIARHYALLAAAQNPTTGLVPNWTNEAGVAVDPGNGYPHDWSAFGYDAIRVPWRAAWAWQWFWQVPEHAAAHDVASRICTFITTATGGDAQNIRAEYSITGTPLGADVEAGPGVVGAYAAGCMVDPAHQAMLDVTYDRMQGQTADYHLGYYQTTLQVLEALLLTGSMPNPWDS